jgi:hypothetical protein
LNHDVRVVIAANRLIEASTEAIRWHERFRFRVTPLPTVCWPTNGFGSTLLYELPEGVAA